MSSNLPQTFADLPEAMLFLTPGFEHGCPESLKKARLPGHIAHNVITDRDKTYLLNLADEDLILFRELHKNLPEWTFYLRLKGAAAEALNWTETEWREALAVGQVGRLVGCKPGGRYGSVIFTLLFASDGTGQCHHNRKYLDFTWDWTQTDLLSPEHLLTADLVDLSLFSSRSFYEYCAQIIREQIAKRIKNPFVDPGDLHDKPFQFDCGSAEELWRVTLWICHTDPALFAEDQGPVRVIYYAPSGTRPPESYLYRTPFQRGEILLAKSPRLKQLFRLAYTHNALTGWTWTYQGLSASELAAVPKLDKPNKKNGWRHRYVKPPNRRDNYAFNLHTCFIEVHPPSAHERAESLLELSDWLDGKVSVRKKRQLLGLDQED